VLGQLQAGLDALVEAVEGLLAVLHVLGEELDAFGDGVAAFL
jgi:hypothetical protein